MTVCLLLAIDIGQTSFLNLCGSFNAIVNYILIERVPTFIGLSYISLEHFSFYRCIHTQYFYLMSYTPNPPLFDMKFLKVQCSVLSIFLSIIYYYNLFLKCLGLSFHFYVDDTHIYINYSPIFF